MRKSRGKLGKRGRTYWSLLLIRGITGKESWIRWVTRAGRRIKDMRLICMLFRVSGVPLEVWMVVLAFACFVAVI